MYEKEKIAYPRVAVITWKLIEYLIPAAFQCES